MTVDIWEHEQPAAEHIDVPGWIEQDITGNQIAAIRQGGCESGAYMPAVTYYQAAETMAKHGDDVLTYLEEQLGELPPPPDNFSWAGLAVHYLSYAVDWWATGAEEELTSKLEEAGTP